MLTSYAELVKGGNGGAAFVPENSANSLIVDRLEALGKLDDYEKLFPLKDWSKDRAGGPRTFQVEGYLP